MTPATISRITAGTLSRGAADQFEGGIVAAALMGEDTQAVEAVGVIGIEREAVAVEALGFRQAARPMMPDREIEHMIGRPRGFRLS